MGANHVRVVGASAHAEVAVVVDCDLAQADRLARPAGAVAAPDVEAVLGCDAVIVACPTELHPEIGLALLDQGVPLLIEKPLACDAAQAEALVERAATRGVPLMCGFVERFNAAVATAAARMGEAPRHCVSIRHSPPARRIATSVVYDLLIHDIDLVLGFLRGAEAHTVGGAAPPDPATGVAEVADCLLQFAGGAVATLSASRASQRKIRSLLLATSSELFEVDLLRQNVTVFRNVDQTQVDGTPGYRSETIVDIPFVRHGGEPLALQLAHFLRLVDGDADPAAELAGLLPPHRVAAAVQALGAHV
jgi:predicted dehydrogenase